MINYNYILKSEVDKKAKFLKNKREFEIVKIKGKYSKTIAKFECEEIPLKKLDHAGHICFLIRRNKNASERVKLANALLDIMHDLWNLHLFLK